MSNGQGTVAFSGAGFTLLEVLMVVLLVGIISSVVMLNVGTGGAERHLREESDRLVALLGQAASEAVMQNQEYGLRLSEEGYTFLCLDEAKQRWAGCADNIFRAREIPESLELRVLRQGPQKELPLAGDSDAAASTAAPRDGQEGQRITPDIFLLSSGEASAASLELRVKESPELRSEIRIDEIGRVSRAEDAAAGEARDAG
jgi:general secretion pathway protein H